jgi:hypothetical protein
VDLLGANIQGRSIVVAPSNPAQRNSQGKETSAPTSPS